MPNLVVLFHEKLKISVDIMSMHAFEWIWLEKQQLTMKDDSQTGVGEFFLTEKKNSEQIFNYLRPEF